MIVYKVVTLRRESCNRLMTKFLRGRSKWIKTYKTGETVRAVKGSMGIICFRELQDAEQFRQVHVIGPEKLQIIRVEGIGEPNYPTKVLLVDAVYFASFRDVSNCQGRYIQLAPHGTITFNSVKVLD